MSRSTSTMLLTAVLSLAACGGGSSPPGSGTLDTTFASPAGYVSLSIPGVLGTRGVEVAVQPDGRIVVAGRWITFASDDVLVARFTADGRLDATFGQGGVFTYAGAGGVADTALGLALQPDGNILVAGYVNAVAASRRDVLVLRLTPGGRLDPTFGTGGVFTYDGGASGTDLGFAVRVQVDGKIVVAGEAAGTGGQDALLLRLTPAGALDPTFASGGVFLYSGASSALDRFFDLRVLSSGAIVATGTSGETALVVKVDEQGQLDPTFGTAGAVTLSIPSGARTLGYAICIQADGKLVVAGTAGPPAEGLDAVAARLLPSGSLDTTFAAAGWFIHQLPGKEDDAVFACDVRPDGTILLGGTLVVDELDRAAAFRLTSAGVLDPSFGAGGVSLQSMSSTGYTTGIGMAVQADGKILLVGSSEQAAGEELLLMRLLP